MGQEGSKHARSRAEKWPSQWIGGPDAVKTGEKVSGNRGASAVGGSPLQVEVPLVTLRPAPVLCMYQG